MPRILFIWKPKPHHIKNATQNGVPAIAMKANPGGIGGSQGRTREQILSDICDRIKQKWIKSGRIPS